MDNDKILKGLKEQTAYGLIIRLVDAGMDPEITGQYIRGVSEGRVDQVMETLNQIAFKFLKPKED